jgi:hypothetical protein
VSGNLSSVAQVSLTTGVSGVLPIANGGTNNSGPFAGARIMVSSVSAIVEAAALTNGQLLIGVSAGSPTPATLTGTANQVNVANGAGSITLSLPQSIATTSSVTFANITDTALTPNGVVRVGAGGLLTSTGAMTNGQILIGSTGVAPVLATLAAGANGGVVIANGAGSITLSTVQDIRTSASPTFTGMTLSGLTQGSILFAGPGGLISQDNANFFWDDANNRLGIGTSTPQGSLDVNGSAIFRGSVSFPSSGGGNYQQVQTAILVTTDNSLTTIATVAVATGVSMLLIVQIIARRVSGTQGAAGDSAAYKRDALVKNISGTVTVELVQTSYTAEDQNNWNVLISDSGANVLIQVQGTNNNTVNWNATYFMQTVS